jgi:hypothetical protein
MFKNGLCAGHFYFRHARLFCAVTASLLLHGLFLYSIYRHSPALEKPLRLVLDLPIRMDVTYLGEPEKPSAKRGAKPVFAQDAQAPSLNATAGLSPETEAPEGALTGSALNRQAPLKDESAPDVTMTLPTGLNFGFSHKRRAVFEPPSRPQNHGDLIAASKWFDEKIQADIRNKTLADLLADLYKLDKHYDEIQCQLGPYYSCDVDHGPTLALLQRHQKFLATVGGDHGMTLRFSGGQWFVDVPHPP